MALDQTRRFTFFGRGDGHLGARERTRTPLWVSIFGQWGEARDGINRVTARRMGDDAYYA